MNLGDIFEKDYYFEFEPKKNYETGKVAHKLPQGTNEPLRFTIEEMYLLRQFFKEYGSDASFDELYEFNEDLYLDNAEILLDIICSRLNTVYLEEEMMLMDNISPDDYTVIWPESLINDVLDDDLLDWKAIKEAENDTDEDESNLDTLSTTLNIGDTIMATKDTVLETMKQAGTPLNAGKIAELSGLDRKEVDKAMKELKAEGAIVSPVRCKWEPAQK